MAFLDVSSERYAGSTPLNKLANSLVFRPDPNIPELAEFYSALSEVSLTS
jgi:hypothetical protein